MRKFQSLHNRATAVASIARRAAPTQMCLGRVSAYDAGGTMAQVKMAGSGQTTNCVVSDGIDLTIGSQVLVVYFPQETRPIVLGTVRRSTKYVPSEEMQKAEGLEAPSNVQAFGLENTSVVVWDAPLVNDQFFIVQYNDTESEVDAETAIITQGSYYIYNGTGLKYYRVQSAIILNESVVQGSAWSSWVNAQATLALSTEIDELEDRLNQHIAEGI